MTNYELLSISLASIAILVSIVAVLFSGIQAKKASETLKLEQELTKGNVIAHFTSQFFDLLKEGELHVKIKEKEWANRFWSILSTEFYFFHHGILPSFMFNLWMIDLVSVYCLDDGDSIRESHTRYLETYSFSYPEMTSFFSKLHQIATKCSHANERNEEVSSFVKHWYKNHKRSTLD